MLGFPGFTHVQKDQDGLAELSSELMSLPVSVCVILTTVVSVPKMSHLPRSGRTCKLCPFER